MSKSVNHNDIFEKQIQNLLVMRARLILNDAWLNELKVRLKNKEIKP